MKKFVYIFAVVAIILVVSAVIFFRSPGAALNIVKNANLGSLPGTSQNPTPLVIGKGATNAPVGDTISLGTPSGVVVVNNFYKNLVDTEEGSVIFRVGDGYQISYNTSNSNFRISIWKGPLDGVRQAAEKDFVSLVGVNMQDACRLLVYFVIPKDVDLVLSTQKPGLSFCAKGVK